MTVIPPYNAKIEQDVLGIFLTHPETISDFVDITDLFYVKSNRVIWEVIRTAFINSWGDVDLILFEEMFKRAFPGKELNDKIKGGMLYVADLLIEVTSAAPIARYVDELLELRTKRNLLDLSQEIQDGVGNGGIAQKLIDGIYSNLDTMQLGALGNPRTMQVMSSGDFLKIRPSIMQARKKVERTILTPWEGANDLLFQGFTKGGVSVFAARAKLGKTTAKQNLITHWCEMGYSVYDFTPEQGLELEWDGLVANISDVPMEYLQNPRIGIDDEEKIKHKIMEAEKKIDSWNLVVDGTRGRNFAQLVREARIVKSRTGLDIMVIDLIDYLQDIRVSTSNRNYVIGDILRNQADISQELDIHIMNVWQIHRGIERKDHRPQMSDLRDSGAAEEVCNLILLLFRESYYDDTTMNDETELIICPQRGGGESGVAKLRFVKPNRLIDYDKFSDEYQDEPPF